MPQLSKKLTTAYNASNASGASSGNNAVITGVAGKRIAVYGFTMSATVALGAATVNSEAGGRELARFGMTSGSIVILPVGKWPWFTTDVGDDLDVTNLVAPEATSTTQGNITYRIED